MGPLPISQTPDFGPHKTWSNKSNLFPCCIAYLVQALFCFIFLFFWEGGYSGFMFLKTIEDPVATHAVLKELMLQMTPPWYTVRWDPMPSDPASTRYRTLRTPSSTQSAATVRDICFSLLRSIRPSWRRPSTLRPIRPYISGCKRAAIF